MKRFSLFPLLILFVNSLFLNGQAPALLKDLNGEPKSGGGSKPHSFFGIGGKVLFVAKGKGVGVELFVSSGSPAGTRLLVDLNPGPKDSDLQMIGVRGGKLFFFRSTPGMNFSTKELWVSDGTPVGTLKVGSGFPGFPQYAVGLGKVFYFFSWDRAKKRPVLFRTDGTVKGTFPLFDGDPKAGLILVRSMELKEWKGALFFLAFFKDSLGLRLGLFRSDGSQKGTKLLIDFPKARGIATIPALFPLNGELGIGLDEPGSKPFSLFLSKGTKGSKRKGVLPGGSLLGGLPSEVASDGTNLFLILRTQKEGEELWRTDGTAKGLKVVELSPGGKGTRVTLGKGFLGGVLFAAKPEGKAQGLFLSDGSAVGARRLCNLPFAHVVKDVGIVGGKFLFANSDQQLGGEPWISDGTQKGTRVLVDLEPGRRGSNPRRFTKGLGKVLFASSVLGIGEDPWLTDGTRQGTRILARLNPPNPGTGDGNPVGMQANAVGGTLFFRAEDPQRGVEIWGTDGTPSGTRVLGDLEPGSWGSNPGESIGLEGKLLFAATRTGVGRELFASNGGPGGTGLLMDLEPGSRSGDPRDFVRVGREVFFSAFTLKTGRELWITDGTPSGTGLRWDIRSGPQSSFPKPLAAFKGKLLFLAEQGMGVPSWFLGDGTAKGSVNLLDPKKAIGVKKIWGTYLLGSQILAFVREKTKGLELWKSFGKKGDANILTDLFPGIGDGVKKGGFVFEGRFYFLGRKGPGGFKLFQSDGTVLGTKQVPFLNLPNGSFQFLTNLPSLERGKLFGFLQSKELGKGLVDLFLVTRGARAIKKIGAFSVLEKGRGQVFGGDFPQLGTRFAYFEALNRNGFPRLFRTDGTSTGTAPLPFLLKEGKVIGALPKGLLLAGTDVFFGRELYLWDPGALSLPRGVGCDGVDLRALDPVLGKPLLVGGSGKGIYGLLFAGLALNPSFQIRVGCHFYLNPLVPLPSLPFLISRGLFATSLPLPNLPALQGLRLSMQAVLFNPNPASFSFSNAIDLRLGY
jgi:ELWxxDGT repeat protein